MRPRSALVAIVLSSLLLAACGGGRSKEEVVAEGDKICQRTTDEIGKVEAPQSVEEVKAYGPEVAAIIRPAVDDLKKLDPPDDGREDFDAFVGAAEEQGKLADQLKDADGEQEVRDLLARGAELDSKSNAAARAYGFKACAE